METWDPDAVRVDLRRAGLVVAYLWIGGFVAFAALCVWSAIANPEDQSSFIPSLVAAALSLLAALWMYAKLRMLRIRRGFALDRRGLHVWFGNESALLGWGKIAALAISYESPPKVPLSGGGLAER